MTLCVVVFVSGLLDVSDVCLVVFFGEVVWLVEVLSVRLADVFVVVFAVEDVVEEVVADVFFFVALAFFFGVVEVEESVEDLEGVTVSS